MLDKQLTMCYNEDTKREEIRHYEKGNPQRVPQDV